MADSFYCIFYNPLIFANSIHKNKHKQKQNTRTQIFRKLKQLLLSSNLFQQVPVVVLLFCIRESEKTERLQKIKLEMRNFKAAEIRVYSDLIGTENY